ncbi:class I SAM-dependent methyltransferase [Tropicimonas omnivorans]|uniref:class I SAM-dependent methyltransferase n=1 Tax=Tropicimonas omnivorans TaxID=3075590 RepID=UPI003D788598
MEVTSHAAETVHARGSSVHATIDEFPDLAFDMVISDHCIKQVEDSAKLVREMHCALKDEGILIAVVPSHPTDFPYRESDRDFHLYSWSAANLGYNVKTCGFDVRDASELKHRWPPQWPLIVRIGGWGAFHLASRIWAGISRRSSPVRCIACVWA